MSLIPKIAAFWLLVYVVLWLLRSRPNSAISKLAFSWQGPYPVEGELKSSYYRRKALFAVGWLVQILTAAAVVSLVLWSLPKSESTEVVTIVSAFALTLGTGMAVLGAVMASLVSLRASLLGPNPAFAPAEPTQETDDEEVDRPPFEV